MFTSCCPGWVRFLKSQFPEMTGRLSTAKSPQQMFGAVGKTWLAHNLGVDAGQNLQHLHHAVHRKKAERELPSMDSAGHGSDVDLVITTRELARMVRAEHLDVEHRRNPRLILRWATAPAQALFSARPAALWRPRCVRRTSSPPAKNPSPDAFREVRDDGTISPLPWREATFELAGRTVRCAVASGLGNARHLDSALCNAVRFTTNLSRSWPAPAAVQAAAASR